MSEQPATFDADDRQLVVACLSTMEVNADGDLAEQFDRVIETISSARVIKFDD